MNIALMKYFHVFLMVLLATTLTQGELPDPAHAEAIPPNSGKTDAQFPWDSENGGSIMQIMMHILQTLLIPIGFTYVQLPKEKSPREIWPMITWKEVSQDYAGVFFRVEGARAGAFGTVQEASLPRITRVQSFNISKWTDGGILDGTIFLNEFGWSDAVYTGDTTDGYKTHQALKFFFSQDEIKPRNMAIRIWRRVE